MKSDGPETVEFQDLAAWFDQRASPVLRGFRRDSRTLLGEIDRSVSNLRAAAEGLASETLSHPSADNQLRYADRLAGKILDSFDRIQLLEVLSFDHVQDVRRKLAQALQESTGAARIIVPHFDSSFKPKIIGLDFELKRLESLVFKLAQVLKSNQPIAQQADVLRRDIDRAANNQARVQQLREEIHKAEEQVAQLRLQLGELDSRHENVRGGDWFIELEQVQAEIGEIEGKFSIFRSQLGRPLRKLHKLVIEGKVSPRPETLVALRGLMEDSTQTLLEKTDPAHVSLLLYDLRRLLEEGKITLEKRKERKVLNAIRDAQESFLDRTCESFARLRRRETELMSASEARSFRQEDLRLEAWKGRIEAEVGALEQSKARLQIELAELQTGLNALSREIEDSISALLGVKVSILTTG